MSGHVLKYFLIAFLGCFPILQSNAQIKTIHVFVSLCDNINQGIVAVPEFLGNGQKPNSNLYWGAAYGVKSYFKKSADWILISNTYKVDSIILERVLFKHSSKDIYLLADAYDGKMIEKCTTDFLKSSNGQLPLIIKEDSLDLKFGGDADLIAYVGHDGLMDFHVNVQYVNNVSEPKDIIILACYSKDYFQYEIQNAQANPLLWTTHLMAPEAYSLKSAIDGWLTGENGAAIEERAAQSYNQYQKCGINGARRLFTTGF